MHAKPSYSSTGVREQPNIHDCWNTKVEERSTSSSNRFDEYNESSTQTKRQSSPKITSAKIKESRSGSKADQRYKTINQLWSNSIKWRNIKLKQKDQSRNENNDQSNQRTRVIHIPPAKENTKPGPTLEMHDSSWSSQTTRQAQKHPNIPHSQQLRSKHEETRWKAKSDIQQSQQQLAYQIED